MNKKFSILLTTVVLSTLTLGGIASAAPAAAPAPQAQTADAQFQLEGGWTVTEGRLKLTKHVRSVFTKALDGLVGCDYEPMALLGTQVVAGRNYCILCRLTPVVPNATSHWALVYIYEDLEGNAKLLSVKDVELGI